MSIFVNLIKGVINTVQQKNEEDSQVKTADKSVFEKLKERMETSSNTAPESAKLPDDIFEQIKQVQSENEADPNVETADKSVFEDMTKEIEALKAKLAAEEEARKNASVPKYTTFEDKPVYKEPTRQTQALTNSNGGSLGIRMEPNMGSPINVVRIPDNSLLKIIKWSDKSINLDGADSKFVLIEYQGQQGWVLDRYLNFN